MTEEKAMTRVSTVPNEEAERTEGPGKTAGFIEKPEFSLFFAHFIPYRQERCKTV
jgi:hypothetical protein